MSRSPKIENPFRKTVIFLALFGFCCSSSLFYATLFLIVASLTFASIIIELSLKLTNKIPASTQVLSPSEKERAALRAQIDDFRMRVGQPTWSTPLYSSSLEQRQVLPASVDAPKMRPSPKLSPLS